MGRLDALFEMFLLLSSAVLVFSWFLTTKSELRYGMVGVYLLLLFIAGILLRIKEKK